MESNGFPMCIHVSKPTMELLSPYEEWLEYGNKEIKGVDSKGLDYLNNHKSTILILSMLLNI